MLIIKNQKKSKKIKKKSKKNQKDRLHFNFSSCHFN